jgi:hypothetical protein
MPESVQILIEADDKASKKFDDASKAMVQTAKQVESVVASLETPTQKYNKQLEELTRLQKSGAITSDQFTRASAQLKHQLDSSGESFKSVGKNAKGAGDAISAFANATGNPEIAALAGSLGMASNEFAKFRDMAGQAGSGSLAFKAGLVGLVGTIAFGVGKAIGDAVFETEKFGKAMQDAKDDAAALDLQIAKMNQRRASEAREDIELIRDPEAKREAYKSLLGDLDKNIAGVSSQVASSKKEVEAWANAWQITGERKAAAEMASAQLANDKARLAALKDQRDEIARILSLRTQENEAIKRQNELQDKSDSFLESLRQEIQLLEATREEQIKLEAARRAVGADVGEAERLLRDRDAILAKQQAERDADAEKKRREDRQKAEDERKAQAAEREIERIKNAEEAERERLKIARIAIEQGKEAAKVALLVSQGIDEATAKQLAAEEAAIDLLKEKNKIKEDKADKPKAAGQQSLQPTESRLLTRGPGQRPEELWKRIADEVQKLRKPMDVVAKATEKAAEETEKIATNTEKTTQIVPVT